MINNVVLVSGIQQSDSVIYMYLLFQILFPYKLLQDTEYSSLCYAVGACWLPILFYILCVNPRLIIYPSPLSALVTIILFSMSVGLFLFCK